MADNHGAAPDPHASAAMHATTQAHGGAEHGGAFPPFDSTHYSSQLIWLVITFGLLYWLMSKVALPRVARILDDRQSKISGDLEAAKKAQADAEAAQAAHEKTLADARVKAQALGQEAHAQAAAEMDAKRKTLEADLAAKLAAADAQIAATKAKAMANVEGIARDTAAAIVQQITGKPADPQKIATALSSIVKG
ncbi:MAG: F0F1 ATP synthase subunit B [Hyphomicrobiales bacterium]|nr:F0F1 ATP synthase subunit B [Hyphomicrobiales bacterium]